MPTQGASARRSRRGYRYQDVHALDRCLDVLVGHWDSIVVEGDEDVTCSSAASPPVDQHEQVKTVEEPSQLWTIAKICTYEKNDVSRSILGRLFLGKALHDGVTFRLVLNEGVGDDLRVLTKPAAERDQDTLNSCTTTISQKLKDLALPDSRTVVWCTQRLSIEVRARSIDELEASILLRLGDAIETHCGEKPLVDEVPTVLSLLMDSVSLEARGVTPEPFDLTRVVALLTEAFAKLNKQVNTSIADTDSSRLRSKLRPLNFDPPVIEKAVEMHLAHRRAWRRADPERSRALGSMVDEVFTACTGVAARRHAGELAPGGETYGATLQALGTLYITGGYAQRGFDLADLERAMLDVASRCQHRFAP